MTNPIVGMIKTIVMFMFKKFKFDNSIINKKIKTEDGLIFTIFRRVVVQTKNHQKPGAYFLVRFMPLSMSPEKNIEFSKKPMMIFMGFKGFRTKYWAVNYDTGLCQGLYEWQTVEDAINYSKSIAMKFMTNRSVPDSIMYRIIDKSKEDIKFEII